MVAGYFCEMNLKIIEIEKITGVCAPQRLRLILAFLMTCKEAKLDLHLRPLGDLYLKTPSSAVAQSGVHFRG